MLWGGKLSYKLFDLLRCHAHFAFGIAVPALPGFVAVISMARNNMQMHMVHCLPGFLAAVECDIERFGVHGDKDSWGNLFGEFNHTAEDVFWRSGKIRMMRARNHQSVSEIH